jgi:hypothetical protein
VNFYRYLNKYTKLVICIKLCAYFSINWLDNGQIFIVLYISLINIPIRLPPPKPGFRSAPDEQYVLFVLYSSIFRRANM